MERFEQFFARPEVRTLSISEAVFEHATELRAKHRLSTPDALHLAAAIDADCEEFWTNDRRLERAAHVEAGDRVALDVTHGFVRAEHQHSRESALQRTRWRGLRSIVMPECERTGLTLATMRR